LFLQENKSDLKTSAVLLLAAAIGGLNEVNAICCALAVTGLFLLQNYYYPQLNLSKASMLLAVLFIILSLSFNLFSGGYESRMNGLPHFTLPQSIKNTVHTFALPLMQREFIILRLFALLCLLFFIDTDFSKLKISEKDTRVAMGLWVIIGVSFFLHCFILSDIVPARGEIWGYTLGLFVLSVKAGRNRIG
jgi:hypothetical protein